MNGRGFTEEEREYLRSHYPHEKTRGIAEELGRSYGSVNQAALKMGLRKTAEFMAAHRLQQGATIGSSTRFQPGHAPANKGTRRPGWAPGRMADTQFRKGARTGAAARNWKPVGTIATDTDGYFRIKVREAQHGKEPTGFGNGRVWPFLHRHLWQQAHGPIPEGHLVIFRDGDKTNCVLENLDLITMAENARRNSMWNNMPHELAEVIQLQGQVKRRIRERMQCQETR